MVAKHAPEPTWRLVPVCRVSVAGSTAMGAPRRFLAAFFGCGILCTQPWPACSCTQGTGAQHTAWPACSTAWPDRCGCTRRAAWPTAWPACSSRRTAWPDRCSCTQHTARPDRCSRTQHSARPDRCTQHPAGPDRGYPAGTGAAAARFPEYRRAARFPEYPTSGRNHRGSKSCSSCEEDAENKQDITIAAQVVLAAQSPRLMEQDSCMHACTHACTHACMHLWMHACR